MKIGIFDSGLGGLIITHSLINKLPQYDYLYLGDTARVPYGNRSQELVYQYTLESVDYLFKQNCKLIIVACNTASSEALRKIQQEYLPKNYPDRKILGVIIPSVEEVVKETRNGKIGVIATYGTVNSKTYIREIQKLRPNAQVYQKAAPLLVPLIEYDGLKWVDKILDEYLAPLLQKNIDTLILGCTHYAFIKKIIQEKVGKDVVIISQDEVVPKKLEDYLARHPEIEKDLSKKSQYEFSVTSLSEDEYPLADQLFGKKIHIKLVTL